MRTRKNLVERLKQYGLTEEEIIPDVENVKRAKALIITEKRGNIRGAIKLVGYDTARKIYAYHMYYMHMQRHFYAAQDFDDNYYSLYHNK